MRILVNLLHAQATLTGTGYYALHLMEAMLELPQQPQITGIVSPFNAKSFDIRHANFRQVEWGHPWKSVMARRVEEWARLESLIRCEKPDVFWGPSNFLPWRRTVPYVTTVHDMTFFDHPEFLPPVRRWYWHRWTHRTIAVADEIMTVSNAAKSDIVKYSAARQEHITVVHNGAGNAFFIGRDEAGRAARREALRAKFPNLPEDYVFFLGTLTSHKNVPRLVEAAASARREGCADLHLVMAGKRGSGYDEVAAAIQRTGAAEFVHELGYVSDEWMPALYENARVHVLPSFTEGFGLPIVEAMACGTPVVTSNSGAMAEVAGDGALLADPRQTSQIADAIRRLWTDMSLHETMRRKALDRADEFRWSEAARKTYEVMERASLKARTS